MPSQESGASACAAGSAQPRNSKGAKVFKAFNTTRNRTREKETQIYRKKATERLVAFLKETLKDEQLQLLRQLELQQEGAFALSRPDIGKELKLTDVANEKSKHQLAR